MITSVIALMAAGLAAASDGSAATQQTTTAAGSPAASAPTTNPQAKDPNKMVCRTIVPTGQRLGGERICHTQSEWAEINHTARDMVTNAQMTGGRTAIPGN
jgi:hypothetical protein